MLFGPGHLYRYKTLTQPLCHSPKPHIYAILANSWSLFCPNLTMSLQVVQEQHS